MEGTTTFAISLQQCKGSIAGSASASAGYCVERFSSVGQVPAVYDDLLEHGSQRDFFLSPAWFNLFASTALPRGECIQIYGIRQAEDLEPLGLFMGRTECGVSKTRLRKLSALANYYSCFFAPHFGSSPDRVRAASRVLARALTLDRPSWDAIEIQPLDVASEEFAALVGALRSEGFLVQTYFCFGNWYLRVNGRTFAEYLESRPSAVKNTLKRKRKKLESLGSAKIEIITDPRNIEAAIDAYAQVYLASWKRPEPYPEFIPGLVRLCAGTGGLRLGLVRINGVPAAAQLWIVHGGKALIYKLAYDERFTAYSLGTILTATLMECVLDRDKVEEVDYLSGDDTYKQDWMPDRRERWGILALNCRTLRGSIAAAQNVAGRIAKGARTIAQEGANKVRSHRPNVNGKISSLES